MFTGELKSFQDEVTNSMVKRRKALLAYPMGSGKGLELSTSVLTPSGWVLAGAVRAGDRLIGRDGYPTKVLGVYPQPRQLLYRVTFKDGVSVVVDGPHLWSVQTPSQTHTHPDNWRTKSTLELKDDLKSPNGNNRWRIPMISAPVQYDKQAPLPMAPYKLGVVLGDGSLNKKGTRAQVFTDLEILEAIGASSISPEPGCFRGTVPVCYGLGLGGKRSWEKWIPEQYLRSSPEERLDILQGLLDTDGYPTGKGAVEYTSTSESLVDGVIDLVQGLGGTAHKSGPRVTRYTHNEKKLFGRESWRVQVKLPANQHPHRLARKSAQYAAPTKYQVGTRPIVSIEPEGFGDSVCFSVDSGDHLYVIKDHVVTHNTVITLAAIEELMETGAVREPGIILAGASIQYQWKAEIEKFTNSKAVIANGTPRAREEVYAQFRDWRTSGVDYLIITYTTLTNDARKFRGLPKGFVIADESIAIKSFSSKRSKAIKAMFSSTDIRFGLSGTPIENGKPDELYSQMQFVDPTVLGRWDRFDRSFIVRNPWGGVERYKNLDVLHKQASTAVFYKSADSHIIASEMPEETKRPVTRVDMPASTARLYRRIEADIRDDLRRVVTMKRSAFDMTAYYAGTTAPAGDDVLQGMLMSKITTARMLCDHPQLVKDSAAKFAVGRGEGSAYAAELDEAGLLDKVSTSAKLAALEEMVTTALSDPRSKLVIFSVFRGMLDIIEKHLKIPAVIYHGALSAKERHSRKVAFQTDPRIRIFISSDAGGVGVDLPQANALINYDLPWQAGALDQRNARPRRVSSEWDRIVIDQLVTSDSIEEWQLDMLLRKSAVSKAILEGEGITAEGDVEESLNSLLSYLE